MLCLTFLLLASAAADPAPAATSAPADPAPITSKRAGKYKLQPIPEGPDPMQRLIDAQNQSAPRNDGSGGMSGAEADLVMAHYLASVGKRLNQSDDHATQGSQTQGSHP